MKSRLNRPTRKLIENPTMKNAKKAARANTEVVRRVARENRTLLQVVLGFLGIGAVLGFLFGTNAGASTRRHLKTKTS